MQETFGILPRRGSADAHRNGQVAIRSLRQPMVRRRCFFRAVNQRRRLHRRCTHSRIIWISSSALRQGPKSRTRDEKVGRGVEGLLFFHTRSLRPRPALLVRTKRPVEESWLEQDLDDGIRVAPSRRKSCTSVRMPSSNHARACNQARSVSPLSLRAAFIVPTNAPPGAGRSRSRRL
jgi:hypothetical protein